MFLNTLTNATNLFSFNGVIRQLIQTATLSHLLKNIDAFNLYPLST